MKIKWIKFDRTSWYSTSDSSPRVNERYWIMKKMGLMGQDNKFIVFDKQCENHKQEFDWLRQAKEYVEFTLEPESDGMS